MKDDNYTLTTKDEITNAVLSHLDKYYEIYGLEESGELTIYDYPYIEPSEDGFEIEITCKHGVFLRGDIGLKKISKIIHDSFKRIGDGDDKTKGLFPGRILSKSLENDILNLLKYRRTISIKEFDKTISGKETILFNNGKILINFPLDKEVSPYFPPNNNAYKSFQQIPVNFDLGAECPKIEVFLIETFGEESLNFIYQMIGYLTSSSILHQKAFILYGEASTGKTTFIELLSAFIGRKLISNVSLHGLGDRWGLSRTRDKRVNIYDDLSFAKIYNTSYGNFKQLVTNKTLSGEMKYINDLVEWDNTCKCLFGCNQLPFVPYYADTDFFRRLVLIPCRNVVKNKNKNILAELTTPEELSGLLNKALKGLELLFGNGGFPKEWNDIERVQNIWELNSKPSKMFVEDECVFDKDKKIQIDVFNKILRRFRRDKNSIKISDRQIATSMKPYKTDKTISITRSTKNGITYRYYKGIDIDPISEYCKLSFDPFGVLEGQATLDEMDVIDSLFKEKPSLVNVKEKILDTFGEEIQF